jgi:hypothetical protein
VRAAGGTFRRLPVADAIARISFERLRGFA